MARIKICGLFRARDIDFANEAEPDYVGFVFAPSRRQITAAAAAGFREKLKSGVVPVGVFVNAAIQEIVSLFQNGVIEIAQLHGEEDAVYIEALKQRCSVPVIKAVRVETVQSAPRAEQLPADYLLLDNGAGGSGQTFNWDLIGKVETPYFMAGGIHARNIDGALSLNPYAIDVSSGAETQGMKDLDKMIALVRRTRAWGIDV
ncbi:MAG: phosphoribosylanthranilate isomerase [Peptococcaceae bacterium]|jgi:phosphoribosylanthranilate isomerase|nr:phosphoribosylanthranilate isomerase [Peptococcaceae bacterium]